MMKIHHCQPHFNPTKDLWKFIKLCNLFDPLSLDSQHSVSLNVQQQSDFDIFRLEKLYQKCEQK